jgi:hypothetical protein
MQVSVETTSELSRKMTVIVPEDKIRKQVDSRLQSLSSKAKIDGFRPGKVPQAVVRKRYGQQVREEVASMKRFGMKSLILPVPLRSGPTRSMKGKALNMKPASRSCLISSPCH